MIVYPDRRLDVKLNGVWTDITSYVISNFGGTWGIGGHKPMDRIAKTGTLNFALNNADKRFTPSSPTALSGWRKGIEVRLVLIVEGIPYVRWKGFIADIKLDSGEFGSNKHAEIKCLDWMNHAAKFPITLAQTQVNKRADEGVGLVVDSMPIQPDLRDFTSGTDIFATIFDTTTTTTKALSEFAKLVISEFGYLYLKKDKVYGETLRVESRHSRDAGIDFDVIPKSKYESAILGQESGFAVLTEDGAKLAIDETAVVNFNNNMLDMDINYGEDVINHVGLRVYPRFVDETVTVLFKQDSVIQLNAGEIKTNIKGSYTDPYGAGVSGAEMIQPASTTDYQMWQNSNGTGANLTAYLVINATLGTDGVVFHSLENIGGTNGFITKLNARGYPVYTYNAVTQFKEDSNSILENGYSELIIDQKYSSALLPNASLGGIILNQEKTPKVRISKAYFLANTSYDLCAAFALFDVGSVIQIIENQNNINGYYFIQSVEFDISLGGVINFSWGLKEATSLSEQYWILGTAGYSELGVTTFVGY